MIKYLIPIGIAIVLFLFMGFILHWTKYRKGQSGCCSTPNLRKYQKDKDCSCQ